MTRASPHRLLRQLYGFLLLISIAACDHGNRNRLKEPSPSEVEQLRYQMAEALVERGEYEAAAGYIREQLQREPKNARLHLLLGIVLREKGVLGAAEREIRQSIALRSKDPAAHAALGVLLSKRRSFPAAEAAHRRAIELAPAVASYHNDLGFCLLMQRRLDEAREVLEEAIRLDPTMRRAFNNLGIVLGLLDEEDAALNAFSQAGSRAMALTNMGYVYELQGRRGQAMRYYEKALRAQRGYPPALSNLRRLDPSRYSNREAEASEPVEEVSDERTEQATTPATEDEQTDEVQTSAPVDAARDTARDAAGRAAAGPRRVLQGPASRRSNDRGVR
jgi:Flp pilus assembly protein TadD